MAQAHEPGPAPPAAVNADRAQPALVDGARLRWQASPQPGVHRRLLERGDGGELALATSIVRYAPGSRFAAHRHALGEEFMVLRGVFSDEHGSYPAGTYVRNPPGSAHSPCSAGGCVIFVKLRQMGPLPQERLVMRPATRVWRASGTDQAEALLHADGAQTVRLLRLAPGCSMPARQVPGGEEILVLRGDILLDPDAGAHPLARWGWSRRGGAAQPPLRSAGGALLWVKRGHLGERTPCNLPATLSCSSPSTG